MAGLYIHIPFCASRCIYCDFYSTTSIELADRYVDMLLVEYDLRISEVGDESLNTLYIGGGTPSMLSITTLTKLVDGLRERGALSALVEFTIEVNPDDITPEYATALRGVGINRVSMGIQSFDDSELKLLNRRHSSSQAIKAVEYLQHSEFDNISVDLIYGLPEQTMELWSRNLDCVLSLGVQHISAYSLSYEEGTRLYRLRDSGEIKGCSDELYINMYDSLVERLTADGFEHYEVSNFALKGRYSKHNSSYWDNTLYIGLGAAAHSYDGKCRRYNCSSVKGYIDKLSVGEVAFTAEVEELYERYNDYVMTTLRTMWGANLNVIDKRFGKEFHKHFTENIQQFILLGDMKYLDDMTVVITMVGVMRSDAIIRELFYLPD